MKGRSWREILIAAAGWLMFGLGWAGVFLPGLPTTIFWILAALAFLRVNRRMYARIIAHPRFGAAVRMFVEERRISRRGKIVSITAMLLGASVGVLAVPLLWLKILVAIAALAGSVWVSVLPSPPGQACLDELKPDRTTPSWFKPAARSGRPRSGESAGNAGRGAPAPRQ